MAIKNTKLGGTDNVNGDIIDADDVNDTNNALANIAGSDLVDGSISGSTSETNIGEVLLTAGTAIKGVLIVASGYFASTSANVKTSTIKLYSGTNASFASNTLRKTITRILSEEGKIGWSLSFVLTTEETWTGDVYIQITGQNVNNTELETGCETLVVLPIGGAI